MSASRGAEILAVAVGNRSAVVGAGGTLSTRDCAPSVLDLAREASEALSLAPLALPLTDAELDLLAARYPAAPPIDYDAEPQHTQCEAGLDDCTHCVAELRQWAADAADYALDTRGA